MNLFIKIAHKIGMNSAIAYSSGSRVIGGFAGVTSVFFITTFLTGVEQGFYYTFGSVLALQVFFELGLTGIMTQYVAHESSHLVLGGNWKYNGEQIYKSRLASLIHFCIKWYAIISVALVIFLLVVGNYYFKRYGNPPGEYVEWQTPWLIICIATGIKLFQGPLTSIITGLGFIKEMSKISFWQQMITPVFTWIGFIFGLKLYVVGLGYIISTLVWFSIIYKMKLHSILINLWNEKITNRVSYIKEIFPYQWRIALSWISGYFIFQLFNPVLFATEGAVVAGQMGLTQQALTVISVFSMSWLNTKVPLYSSLIAMKEYKKLDNIFNITIKQMSSICFFLLLLFFLALQMLEYTHFSYQGTLISERFLETQYLVLMMIPVFCQQFISSWATYLRCHKAEPFLIFSIVHGCLCLLSTFFLGNLYGIRGITISYCIITLGLVPWAYKIFINYRRKWHEEE